MNHVMTYEDGSSHACDCDLTYDHDENGDVIWAGRKMSELSDAEKKAVARQAADQIVKELDGVVVVEDDGSAIWFSVSAPEELP